MESTSQERISTQSSAEPPRQIYLSEGPDILDRAAIGVQLIDPSLYYCGAGESLASGRDEEFKVSEEYLLGRSANNSAQVYILKINAQRLAHKRFWVPSKLERGVFRYELRNLSKLRATPHRHIVTLMCSYMNTEHQFAGVVLSPAGEFDLKTFLSSMDSSIPDPNLGFKKKALARWYGCSATALAYIHDTVEFKHKDIKLQNILVHGNNIKIIDFGISKPIEGSSATSGPSDGTKTNMSPETLTHEKRGRKQDIWSLGCVFLEMETCRLGISLKEFHKHRGHKFIADQLPEIQHWIERLFTVASDLHETSAPLYWIRWMLQKEETDRPSARSLRDTIEGSKPYFMGKCCSTVEQARYTSLNVVPDYSSIAALPKVFAYGSVAYFVSSSVDIIAAAASQVPVLDMFRSVLRDVQMDHFSSLRSIEVELLIHLGPAQSSNADSYLLFCNAFIKCLIDAVCSGDYTHCYTPDEEKPYTNAYFKVLVDEILDMCRTQFGGSSSNDSTKIAFFDNLADY
ncbi:MAG: hypothetical protein M1836_007131 [Candelina mexicana]|nr:MAG: hypothetical protein M1836_007131 [Candelina mexicana]